MEENPAAYVWSQAQFDAFYKKHAAELHRFLYYKYGAEHNPEDLVQEAFLKLWNNRRQVSPEKAKGFLFTVANNQMLNDLARKKTVLNHQVAHTARVSTLESPEYILEQTEYQNRVFAAIEDLADDMRVTFLLNRLDGKKHQEIAELLGISRKAVEKRLYKAYSILKEKIGKF